MRPHTTHHRGEITTVKMPQNICFSVKALLFKMLSVVLILSGFTEQTTADTNTLIGDKKKLTTIPQ